MRSLDSSIVTALGENRLKARLFFYIIARNRADNSEVPAYFWNDVGPITHDTIDGQTGSTVSRTYTGSGSLITCSSLAFGSDLTIKTLTVTLARTNDTIDTYVRGYDLKNAKVQVHLGIYDPATHALIAQLFPMFVGSCDGAKIETPTPGGEGIVQLHCVSDDREGTRPSLDVRSHESQLKRNPADNFLKYAGVPIELFWATQRIRATSGAASAVTPAGKASGGGPIITGLLR